MQLQGEYRGMSDFLDLTKSKNNNQQLQSQELRQISELQLKEIAQDDINKIQLNEANLLIDDIVLKNYLTKLHDFEVIPLDESLKQINDIRFFKISEMVYQSNEYSTYKFASVFNSLQNLHCGIFIIAHSDGNKTEFYMGVRSFDSKRTTKSLKDTLKNSLCGQFPGVKSKDLLDPEAENFLKNIPAKNIAAVSCIANNKDEDFKDNEKFIQGLEKLSLAMQGQVYTAVILAKSVSQEQLVNTRCAYEQIYTQLSPFATMQISYGKNQAVNVSDSFSMGTSYGESQSTNVSMQKSYNHSSNSSVSHSVTKKDWKDLAIKAGGSALLGVASFVTAPLTGGASLVAAGAISAASLGLSLIDVKTVSDAKTEGISTTIGNSKTVGKTDTVNKTTSKNYTHTDGISTGTTENVQLTKQNKTLVDILERIDKQLKRIDECESLGMWECAAYFLSDSQETVEMAAGTYKAIMRGESSGIETSAVNFWGRKDSMKVSELREYITHFVHPVFVYRTEYSVIPVTAASLVSGNELAIQMGLPRKSVKGLPVIRHANFAQEVLKKDISECDDDTIFIGQINRLGEKTNIPVNLDLQSLSMHAFITGSTGSGKSNAIYQILFELYQKRVKFLVIEPAKGEYKNVIGKLEKVKVYGTNPLLNELLRINPFSFPKGIHIYEHLDRLVEIFNVCWPMYAAMPAILKDAIERSYIKAGWNLKDSTNKYTEQLFPSFIDVLEQIDHVVELSQYSDTNKSDYKGALSTRVKSLTTGINRLIFTADEISTTDLFDENVIVDLSRIGSSETKSLIMGLLVMKLQEHRMASCQTMNSDLHHITILEEAHNLLKRTSTEQNSESANLLGKSVEMLTNAIAEMRTYGEGFIIADQSPGLLDISVIRNTNTKIIMRLPDFSDRELVGRAAGLDDEQLDELVKLPKGVAAIYQNNWLEAVLCSIQKYELTQHNKNNISLLNTKKIINVRGKIISKIIAKENFHLLLNDISEDDIIKDDIPVTAKCLLLYYMNNPINTTSDVASIVYELFSAKFVFESMKEQYWGLEELKYFISEHLIPPLKDLPQEYNQWILNLIIFHQLHVEKKNNNPKLLDYLKQLNIMLEG